MDDAAAVALNNRWKDFIRQYYHNPVMFVVNVLGVIPDLWQAQVMEDVANGVRGISIRSGHGVGKTTVFAWLMIWFITTRVPSKVQVTAPTAAQLYDALFAETKTWIRHLPEWLCARFEVKADRIELRAAPDEVFISLRTSRAEQPDALQGVHSRHVLLIGDEASGIPDKVFIAARGSMSGENATTLLAGNPVYASGFFYETHHSQSNRWKTYHINAEESHRVSRTFIEEMREDYGEDSNVYRVRVLGEFPTAEDDTVIPIELVEQAQARQVETSPTMQWVWGLDVARFGDDETVLTKRKGGRTPSQISWQKLDLMQTCGRVKAEYDGTPDKDRPRVIMVDSIGIGAGVVDRLRELGLPVRGINVSETPAVGDKFRNLRAELWFRMKDWLMERACSLPVDNRLKAQLATVRFKYTSSGKLQIESKDEMKKRGKRSPDRADSLALTFADANVVTTYSKGYSWSKPLKRGLPVV